MTWLIWGCLAADGRGDDKVAGEWEGESTGEGSKGLCYRLHLQYLLMYVGKKCCQHWARHFPGEITSLDCQWDRRSPAKSLNHSLAVISELQAVGFVIGRSLQATVTQPWPVLYHSFCSFGGRFSDPLYGESRKDTWKQDFGWSMFMTTLKDILYVGGVTGSNFVSARKTLLGNKNSWKYTIYDSSFKETIFEKQ